MDLGQLVVAQIGDAEAVRAQGGRDPVAVLLVADLEADEDVGLLGVDGAGADLGDAALAYALDQGAEGAHLFGDVHGDEGLALGAYFGAVGDVAQAVEVHVGAGDDGDQGLVLQAVLPGVGAQASQGERAGWLGHDAGVLEDVLDGTADLVGAHEDDVVQALAAELEGEVAHALDGHAVGEEAHVAHLDRTAGRD